MTEKKQSSGSSKRRKKSSSRNREFENRKERTSKHKKGKSRQSNGRKKGRSSRHEEQRKTSIKMLSGIGNIIFYLVLFTIFAGAIFFNFSDNPDKSFFNYRFMSVLTDSMAKVKGVEFDDGFSRGAIIIIKKEDITNLKKDDIITFYPSRDTKKAFLTHRIYDIDKEKMKENEQPSITTKGDANDGIDIPIYPDQVVGKVVYTIPQVGAVLNFVRKNIVIVAIFFVMLFASLVTLKYYVQL